MFSARTAPQFLLIILTITLTFLTAVLANAQPVNNVVNFAGGYAYRGENIAAGNNSSGLRGRASGATGVTMGVRATATAQPAEVFLVWLPPPLVQTMVLGAKAVVQVA